MSCLSLKKRLHPALLSRKLPLSVIQTPVRISYDPQMICKVSSNTISLVTRNKIICLIFHHGTDQVLYKSLYEVVISRPQSLPDSLGGRSSQGLCLSSVCHFTAQFYHQWGEVPILTVAEESGFLQYTEKNNFLRLKWENALFLWNQNPELPRFHFHQPYYRSLAMTSVGLELKPVSRVFPPCQISVQPSIRLVQFVSCYSPSVYCMWCLHGYGPCGYRGSIDKCKAQGTMNQERGLLYLDSVFPNFLFQAWIGPISSTQ